MFSTIHLQFSFLTIRGVQKLTGKNLKVVWGQVFHFKLDSFAVIKEADVQMHAHV